MIAVSAPQVRYIPEITVSGYVSWLRERGVDVHEFATAYVHRTEQLGYAPDLAESVQEFVGVLV